MLVRQFPYSGDGQGGSNGRLDIMSSTRDIGNMLNTAASKNSRNKLVLHRNKIKMVDTNLYKNVRYKFVQRCEIQICTKKVRYKLMQKCYIQICTKISDTNLNKTF